MIEVLEALGDEGIDNEEPASTLVLYAEKKAGILDLSSKGWSSYNVGLDKDMYADKAYTIYNGAKLDVLGEDTNVNGNKVYYVYSPDLNMKCYITAKYVNVTQ